MGNAGFGLGRAGSATSFMALAPCRCSMRGRAGRGGSWLHPPKLDDPDPGVGVPVAAGGLPQCPEGHRVPVPVVGRHVVAGQFRRALQAFGANVIRAYPVHGKVSTITHDGRGLFRGMNQGLTVTRYHSLVVERESLPDCLEVTAWLEDGTIMGLRHKDRLIEGVQFHPESIASEHGHQLLRNFLEEAAAAKVAA